MIREFTAAAARRLLPPARWLFFRRALIHPLQLATPLPSSQALGRLIAAHVRDKRRDLIVEIGGGTGVVTRALLEAGVSPDRLIVIELDEQLADYLREALFEVRVITGDARQLAELLLSSWRGRVGTIISGVPMTVLSAASQRALIDAVFAVLAPDGRFMQYTYSLGSPLRAARLALRGRRLGITFGNFPPASVWTYSPREPQ